MSIFDFLSGQFIDVIHWTNDTSDTMVWRFERHGHEIKYGAKLTVREGQAAVFVHEGQLADTFTPGLYFLETNNMPILTTLQHWDHGFKSPFKSEIYFVDTTRFTDLKWGTKNPVILRDPEFGPTRIRAFGTYTVRVTEPARFLQEIVGTDGEFTMDEISYQIRNIIVQEFSRVIARSGIPVLDMAANTQDLGALVAGAISETIASYGLEVPELYIENISLPKVVEDALDKRTSMGVVNDLDRYRDFATAEALNNPESGAGSSMATGMGAGLGMAIGAQMARSGPWGPVPPAPPPPPVEHVWHIAKGSDVTGPFSKARLGRMATEGAFGRDTLVWTQGQDGWKRAEEVTELAQLFTVMPPPPPGS
ncbi:MAG: SPFH domain-containing protein [Alphaproteobacteria bacterium]|nr:SPFH domain-containing protein [Alphaproteobacteria bacterium]